MGHELEALSGRVIEAGLGVHKELGPGFLESIYEKAMKVALAEMDLAYEAQVDVPVVFRGVVVGVHRLDLVVGKEIVLELKAVKTIEDVHLAQLRSYLKATGLRVGRLLNFNAPTLVIKRVVL